MILDTFSIIRTYSKWPTKSRSFSRAKLRVISMDFTPHEREPTWSGYHRCLHATFNILSGILVKLNPSFYCVCSPTSDPSLPPNVLLRDCENSVSYHVWYTKTETKWPRFCRRHFQMHFSEWESMYLYSIFTEICSPGSNYQSASIGSDNDLAPIKRQVIIWTKWWHS